MAKSKDPTTNLNESLCCIALGFIREFPDAEVDDFFNFIITEDDDGRYTGKPEKWNKCLEDVEISINQHKVYYDTYSKPVKNREWVYGSYYTAKSIRNKLNIVLKNYVISKVDKSQNSKAYVIKETTTSAIRSWAGLYKEKVNRNWSPGILSNLSSDKINISDIMLISKDSIKSPNGIYAKIKRMVGETQGFKQTKDLLKDIKIIKSLLTPKLYIELMNKAWFDKDIFGISLKKIGVPIDKNNGFILRDNRGNPVSVNVPLKFINLDRQSANEFKDNSDEFAFLIDFLVRSARNSKTFHEFNNIIKDTITLYPVEFTSKDRLDVKYKFKVPSDLESGNKNSYEYVCWTNFGGGTNSVYFQQIGSGSASGEGGITLTYFENLTKKIPKLKRFILHMKEKRIEYFKNSCDKNKIDYNNIQTMLGKYSLESTVYSNVLYKSQDFARLVQVLLTNQIPLKNKDILIFETLNIIEDMQNKNNQYSNVRYSLGHQIEKNKKKVVEELFSNAALNNLNCLNEFFTTYINFLSKRNNTMGSYFGQSSKTQKEFESEKKDQQKLAQDFYDKLILQEQKEQLKLQQKSLPTKERIRGVGATPKEKSQDTKKKTEDAARKIQLQKTIVNKINKQLKDFKNKQKSKVEVTYKKGFALLANAEFGYMYSEHAEQINDLIKKEVLLSLYAAASGRGYVIFNGKQFRANDYFDKNIKGAPFLKVGM